MRKKKAAGRDAAITEKDSFKTFETRVSPVRARQDTRVRIVYLQPAEVDTGIGRYVYPLEEGGVDEEKLAFWTANERVTGKFSFNLRIKSAYPIEAVRLPNQPQAIIQSQADGEWVVQISNQAPASNEVLSRQAQDDDGLEASTAAAGNTPVFSLDEDLVIYWRHQAGLPGSVELVAHKNNCRSARYVYAGGYTR